MVCHGDACNPNFLIGDDGEVSGFVDLGRTGVADRHADLAPAVLSLGWNFGDGWTDTFLTAYCADGLTVDRDLLELYIRLWNAE
ncbi:phosphotransferase [Luteococcus japonicus]|uniref:Aminoglycoside phosphotransferase n=1 Tax=Luteococcus japonicus LSP_Lj1 TaxID=1255658 RepID=A0A1R4IYH0_9ACTN|nr:phosphotransferase [Luteococcus japonicus]SJN24748.1 aminoglycoside phosphotransferase [Luteococcus japonicus LSP_Lj1]